MIVPGLFGSAFGTYLMRQFFRTLPSDLEEAAILDGCSPWQIYWRILLPHARPAVMVLAVLTWVNVWNDFLWPLLMIQRNSLATLTLGLVRLRGEYVARWPVIMATSMLIMLPLVIIYARRAAFLCPRHRRHRDGRVTMASVTFRASDAAVTRARIDRPWIASTWSSVTVSSSFWSGRPDAARRLRCGWWPDWKRWIPDCIRIGDRDVTNVDPKDRDVAMVFQNYALYPHMTVGAEHGIRVEDRQNPEARDPRAEYCRRRNCLTCNRT